jgi:peptide/nickel transport system substrate-binding protein
MYVRPNSHRRRFGRTAAAALIAFSLAAAACGGDDDGAVSDTTTPTTPAPDDDGDGDGDDGNGDDTATTTPAPVVTEPPASEVEPVYGGRVVVAGEAEVANPWTPAAMQCDSFCQMRARTFYDPLIVVDANLDWRPFLAESIDVNDDATVFTIKVREGIQFHDGTDLDADAVMDNINRAFTGLLIAAAVKDIARNEDGTVLMEKLDDYTFTMQTGFNGNPAEPLPWPLFPYYLGGQGGLIASPTWLASVDGGADPTQAVGTGPFTFNSYAPGDRLVVDRNPNYWLQDDNGNQLPYLDQLEFRVIPDSQVREEALRSRDVDLISTSDVNVVARLRDDSNFETLLQDNYSETNYILMNLTKPYLADRDVRCALLQAIDPVDFNDVVNGGNGTISNGPFTPGQEGYLEDTGRLPYDPDAARDVIAAWEAENGPLVINYSTTPTVTNLTAAQYLSAVWGDVGVEVVIDQIEQSTLITNALFGSPDFDAFGWRNHAGIFLDQQYYWWHGSAAAPPGELALNFGRLDDPVINELFEKSRSEFDPEVRRGYAEDVNRRFAEQCFIIPSTETVWGVHYAPKIENVGRTPIPDGGVMRDGAGFPGQVWLTGVFVAE